MRKTFLVLIMVLVLALSGTAFASDTDINVTDTSKALAISKQGQQQGQDQGQTQGQSQSNNQGQSQSNKFDPTNTQGQGQGQLNNWSQVYYTAPNYLQPQPIYPYLLQMVPGVVADVTKEMPLYDIIQAYDKTKDRVIKAKTYNGWFWDRIRLEDIKQEVLDRLPGAMKALGAKSYSEIRFDITLKMSSRTIGSGGGGGGSVAGFGGGTNPVAYGSNASIMPAVAVNTADPQFQITYYLIRVADQKTSEMKIEPKEKATILYQAPSPPKESPAKRTIFGKEVSD